MLARFRAKVDSFISENNSSAHSIALGFSLGSFIAILPTPGFSVLIGIMILFFVRSINRLALFGGLALWNPIIVSPIYYLSYRVGDLMFGSEPVIKYQIVILDQIYNFTRRFLLGNLMLALSISILSYFMVVGFINRKSQKLSSNIYK